MKIDRWVIGLAAAAILLAGCGSESVDSKGQTRAASARSPANPQKLRVTLDGIQGAANVGVVMAVKRGFFKRVGLDVWAGWPSDPSRPVQYVAQGIDDFGVTQQPQLVVGRENGAPIVAVGSLLSQPTAAMIWLEESKIRGIEDLEGKTIAFPGVPFQKRLLKTVLAQAGLTLADVQLVNLGYNLVPTLLGEGVDAVFGASWNLEGVEMELRGARPVVTRVQELGIPDYEELVVIAREDLVAEDPLLVRDFMAAVARGTAAAAANPKAAAAVIGKAIGAKPDLHRRDREAQMKATLPLLSRSGYMSPDRARGLVDWMYEEGLIEREWPVEALLTNAYR